MRRSHDAIDASSLSIERSSGETHLRHHLSKDGFYRGRQVIVPKPVAQDNDD